MAKSVLTVSPVRQELTPLGERVRHPGLHRRRLRAKDTRSLEYVALQYFLPHPYPYYRIRIVAFYSRSQQY